MKSPFVLLLIPLLTIGAFYVSPQVVRPAHADGPVGVGLVCIADTTATSCPVVPPTLAGPQPSGLTQHFFVSVLVNDSVALNGFDITLLTDTNVLRPSGVTIGNFLSNTHDVIKCIGGVNQLGGSCPTTDTASTIDYSVTGAISSAPATGVLFQADYLVLGNAAKSAISFQTGCANTSVSGGVCVTISSGATAPDAENFQIAKFTNILGGYFDLTPSIGTIQLAKGDSDTNDFVNVVSLNQFSGTVTISTTCSPAGPICTVPPPADVMITPTSPSFAGLNVTVPKTTSPGTYTLNITGTSGTLLPPNSITIQLIVPTPDFAITPNPSNLKFNVTTSGLANIIISSSGNFNGTVTLSVKTNDPALASATLLNQTLRLSAKGTNATRLTVKATIYGGYSVNVTATSGTLRHSSIISVTVLDFSLQVPNKVLTVVNGSSVGSSETVAVNVNDFYNVSVTFSKTVFVNAIIQKGIVGPSSALNVTCSPTTVVIISLHTPQNTSIGTGATNCKVTARDIGDYSVTVTAVSGVGNRTSVHALTFPVTVIAKGFSVALSSNVETVAVSWSTSLNVTIVGNGLGLNDTINVKLQFSSSNLSPLPNINPPAENVSITPTSQNSTITATITTSSTTPAGDYTLTITASGKQSTPTRITVTMLLIVVETASPHDVAVNYVKPSLTSATIGSTVNITITVINNGKLSENVTIQAIVADQTVGMMNVTNLAPGQNVTVTIPWNTSGYSSGAYMIGGKVQGVKGETNLSDNLLRYSTPVTLNPANTSILDNAYTVPLIIVGVIIIAAIAMGLFLLPRRRAVPAK